MKNINIPLEDERYEDLCLIQKYYSEKVGVKLSQAQTLKKLLYENASSIREEQKGESN
uniref:Uncharacterized protein n=1 Tax=uncultured prokaryote TaxID=198431 RepID=A0A0H5Q1K6_9ZZZZ|nr:hypothetical protein [uncultured prokaryote]